MTWGNTSICEIFAKQIKRSEENENYTLKGGVGKTSIAAMTVMEIIYIIRIGAIIMIGIWFFSGTGQCEMLANTISRQLSDYNTEVKDITSHTIRNNMSNTITYDSMIIIFPIYGGDLPEPLEKFLCQLNGNGVATILIALWGGAHTGKALNHSREILTDRGFKVTAGAEIVAKHSYLAQHIPIIDIKLAIDKISEITDFVKRNI